MPRKRKSALNNQSFMPEVAKRPRGMPSNEVIRTEMLRMGLTKEDADDQIDRWLANGFRNSNRTLVKDWRAALRFTKRRGWFPSQKGTGKADSDRLDKRLSQIKAKYDSSSERLL